MKGFAQIIATAIWITGIVIAKGFWSTLAACIVPFWSMYLCIDKAFVFYHII